MVWPQYVVLVRLPKNYMVFKHCQAEVSQIKSPVSFSYSAQKWQKPSIFSTVANAVTFSCGWFGSLKKRRKEAKLNLTRIKEATNSKDVWTKPPSKCSGHLLTIFAVALGDRTLQNFDEIFLFHLSAHCRRSIGAQSFLRRVIAKALDFVQQFV